MNLGQITEKRAFKVMLYSTPYRIGMTNRFEFSRRQIHLAVSGKNLKIWAENFENKF